MPTRKVWIYSWKIIGIHGWNRKEDGFTHLFYKIERKKTLQRTSMFCSAWHNSCLVWILSHPNFWQLHQDQWFWTCCLFPSKWSSLSWLHPKVTPKSNLLRTLVLQATLCDQQWRREAEKLRNCDFTHFVEDDQNWN